MNPPTCVRVASLAFGLLGAASSGLAQNFRISVTNAAGTPCGGTTTHHYYTNQTTQVVLALPTCARYVMIYGWVNGVPDVTQDIPRIIFTGGPSAFPVDIGMGSFVYTDSPGASGARNWGGLDASAVSTSVSTARFSGAISGNLTGSVTGLDELFRFDVGGAIQGDVRASGPGNGSLFVVEAASLAAPRSILLDSGNITRVRVGGDCTGDIVATTGGIAQVIIDGSMSGLIRSWLGSIQFVSIGGELRSDVSPTTVRVYAQDGIRELTAASIAATVSANDNGGTGKLGRLVTTSGGCSGNIVAEGIERFDASQSNSAIDIAGDLSGELCARSGGFKVPVRIRGNVTSTGKIRAIGGPLIYNSTATGASSSTGRCSPPAL